MTIAAGVPDPMDTFESWLLRRVAQAGEAGEVPAELLTELQAEIEFTRATPGEVGHAMIIQEIAEIAGVTRERAAEALATLEAQSTVTREMMMRRIAEGWLEGQRKGFRDKGENVMIGRRPPRYISLAGMRMS